MPLYRCGITADPSRVVANRPRVESLVVDIHCHMLVPEADELAQPHRPDLAESSQRFASPQSRRVSAELMGRIRARMTSVQQRLADMDAMGIDVQVVSPAPSHYCYWAEEELARSLSRMVNDRLAEVAHTHPNRFVAFGTVPLQSPAAAIEEMRRCVAALDMRGFEIGTNVAGQELADPKFESFFAAAQDLGVVLFMHPSGFTEGARLSGFHLNNLIGNPLDSTVAISQLIFRGVLDHYPALKLVVAHGGGTMPAYSGRFDHAYHARADCRCCEHPPSHYLQKMFFDTVVFEPSQLEYLVQRFGAGQLLAGTDYPYDMCEAELVDFVHRTQLQDDELKAILGLNAARLLGLDPGRMGKRAI